MCMHVCMHVPSLFDVHFVWALTIVNTYTVHIYQIVELIEFLIANLKVQKRQLLAGISYLQPVFIYW